MPLGDCGTCCRLVVVLVVVVMVALLLLLALAPVDGGGGIVGLTGDWRSLPSEPVDSIIASGGVPCGAVDEEGKAEDEFGSNRWLTVERGSGRSLRALVCFVASIGAGGGLSADTFRWFVSPRKLCAFFNELAEPSDNPPLLLLPASVTREISGMEPLKLIGRISVAGRSGMTGFSRIVTVPPPVAIVSPPAAAAVGSCSIVVAFGAQHRLPLVLGLGLLVRVVLQRGEPLVLPGVAAPGHPRRAAAQLPEVVCRLQLIVYLPTPRLAASMLLLLLLVVVVMMNCTSPSKKNAQSATSASTIVFTVAVVFTLSSRFGDITIAMFCVDILFSWFFSARLVVVLVVVVMVALLLLLALAPVDGGGGIVGLTGDWRSLPSEPVDSIIASGGVPCGAVDEEGKAEDEFGSNRWLTVERGSGRSLRALVCFVCF
uniref:Uncharacterized protein n=1 Tax=Anopheles atroparvus TaxID=41427 RepID=A0A182ITN2_ANOAO